MFLAHLDELRGRLRRYRKLHVICDQAKGHTSAAVAISLYEHRARIELHLLPAYSPDCNLIERVWWHLHEEVTRNHRCQSMQDLLDQYRSIGRKSRPPVILGLLRTEATRRQRLACHEDNARSRPMRRAGSWIAWRGSNKLSAPKTSDKEAKEAVA